MVYLLKITRRIIPTPLGSQDSTIASSSFSWDNSRQPWRHVAVTVTQNVASRHNVFFYVDPWPRWKTCGKMWQKLEKIWKNVEKCGNMWKMWENVEKMWKHVENMWKTWECLGKNPGKSLEKSRESRKDQRFLMIFVWSTLGQKILILYKFGVEHGPVDKDEDAWPSWMW